jgi:hypothetical protein
MILIAILIFMWVFFLPIFIIGFVLAIPFFVTFLPFSFVTGYYVYSHVGPIPSSKIRQCLSNDYTHWFGTIHIDLINHDNKLICGHPHGIICTFLLFGLHFQPGSKTLIAVAPLLFMVPIIGWMARHLGAIPATYNDIKQALTHTSVILFPGGVPEIIGHEKGEHYTRRQGFLKIARDTNCDILAVYNENNYYQQLCGPLYDLRLFIARRYNVPIAIPWLFGWYWTPLPKRIPIEPSCTLFKYNYKETLDLNREKYYKKLYKD